MKTQLSKSALLAWTILTTTCSAAFAGQAPGAASSPDIAISHHDRVYAAEQFSNTVSVTDPVDNKLLGVIRLGAAPAWSRRSGKLAGPPCPAGDSVDACVADWRQQ